MTPCKHLDYTEGKFTDCEIATAAPHFPDVRYWIRGERWTNNGPNEPPNPRNVQFCTRYGRINEVFGCYGERSCYEPVTPAEGGPKK